MMCKNCLRSPLSRLVLIDSSLKFVLLLTRTLHLDCLLVIYSKENLCKYKLSARILLFILPSELEHRTAVCHDSIQFSILLLYLKKKIKLIQLTALT